MHDQGGPRFPFTIPLATSYFLCFVTLAYIDIQAISTGLIQLQAEVTFLLILLVGGIFVHITMSIAITGTTKTIVPRKVLARFEPRQAVAVLLGLGLTAVWQLYINQIKISPYLASLAPQAQFIFKIDNAIAEESAFGTIGIVLYLFLNRRGFFGYAWNVLLASLGSAFMTAIIFDYFHNTNLAYANNPNALLFVFGLRMIITPVQIYTQSHFSGVLIHSIWNSLA